MRDSLLLKLPPWVFAYNVMKVTELIKELMAIMGSSADAIWNDQKIESKGDLNSSMEIKYLKKNPDLVLNDYSSKQKGFCENLVGLDISL